jgi:hypothetical protein
MREYVGLLNQLHASGGADFDAIEAFWIERVHEFFAPKPFRIRLDASRSLRLVLRDVLAQAEERQKSMPASITPEPSCSTWSARSSIAC